MATVTQAPTWVDIMTCFQCLLSSLWHQNMHDAFISPTQWQMSFIFVRFRHAGWSGLHACLDPTDMKWKFTEFGTHDRVYVPSLCRHVSDKRDKSTFCAVSCGCSHVPAAWNIHRFRGQELCVFCCADLELTDCTSVSLVASVIHASRILTGRLHGTIVGQTGRSDWSVRLVGPTIVSFVNASFDRSDRRDGRSEESNMFDFVRLPIRLSKRVDTTSDWSDRLASRTTNHAAA